MNKFEKEIRDKLEAGLKALANLAVRIELVKEQQQTTLDDIRALGESPDFQHWTLNEMEKELGIKPPKSTEPHPVGPVICGVDYGKGVSTHVWMQQWSDGTMHVVDSKTQKESPELDVSKIDFGKCIVTLVRCPECGAHLHTEPRDKPPVSLDALRECLKRGEKVRVFADPERVGNGILEEVRNGMAIFDSNLDGERRYVPERDILSAERVGLDWSKVKVGDTVRTNFRDVSMDSEQKFIATREWLDITGKLNRQHCAWVIVAHTPAAKEEPIAWLCHTTHGRVNYDTADEQIEQRGTIEIATGTNERVHSEWYWTKLYLRDVDTINVPSPLIMDSDGLGPFCSPSEVAELIRLGKVSPTFKQSVLDRLLAENPVAEKHWYVTQKFIDEFPTLGSKYPGPFNDEYLRSRPDWFEWR